MAHTKRNGAPERNAANMEDRSERAKLTEPEPRSMNPSPASLETPSIGHACLRSECWPGTADWLSGYPSGASASALSAIRHRRPTPGRSGSHSSRPSERAETRFVLNDYEFVTD